MDLSMSADSTESSAPKRRRNLQDDDEDDNNEAMCQSPAVDDVHAICSSNAGADDAVNREPVTCHPISSSTNGQGGALDLSSHHPSLDESGLEPSSASVGTLNSDPVIDTVSESSTASSIHAESSISLSQIQFTRSLNEISSRKVTIFEGQYNGSKAVVMMEKTPFSESSVKSMIGDSDNSGLNRDFVNDVYGKYNLYPRPDLNGIKTTIIHPASDGHILKYLPMRLRMITESADDYKRITLPFITGSAFDIKWVFNILDHKQETERIVFEDPDPETGFILLPDLKWNDANNLNDLYLVAIVHRRDIKSIRDLNGQHLELLKNVKKKGIEAIKSKFGLDADNLRIYFHYQPSYYHLHVHFTALSFEAPGCKVERAHLLDHVINNIELCHDYYERATLTFCERANSKLAQLFTASDN